MPTMNEQKQSAIYVMFDTNAIMAPSGDRLFSRASVSAMQEPAHEQLNVSWFIPSMVRKEREHQIRQLVKGVISAASEMPTLFAGSWLTDAKTVNEKISAIVDHELSELNVQVHDCDPDKVDWIGLMDSAGYRNPPFDINTSKEKGFKDAVIAETFIQLCGKLPAYGTERVILVTGDAMLAENVKARVQSPGVKVLKNLDALRNELNFLASDIEPEDQAGLMARALELIKNDGHFWTIVRSSTNSLVRSGSFTQPIGVFNVVYDEPLFASPIFLRKELGHVYFSCRIGYARRGSRWVPESSGLMPSTGQGLIQAAMNGAQTSDGLTANGPPMQQAPLVQGLFGLGGSEMPAGRIESVELPTLAFICEWRAAYNIVEKDQAEDSFELGQPFVLWVGPAQAE